MCESNDISSTSGGSNSNDSVTSNGEAQLLLDQFWPNALEEVLNLENHDFKNQELPLARIKRIMKLDDDAAMMMISGEAPVLFAKAAELFISELTLRSWIHTENNKRRTLQRNDIAMATSKYDQFDFLIDIVPREEIQKNNNPTNARQQVDTTSIQLSELPVNTQIITPIEGMPFETLTQDQFQAYIQMSQNHLNSYSTMEMAPQIANSNSDLVNDASQFTTYTYNNSN